MRFNDHYTLNGRHAFLSPSQYHWIRYTDEHLDERFITAMMSKRGDDLHELASNAIKLGVKFQGRTTIAQYVNDAIGYRMTPEQILYYSDNCFGTADAIKLDMKKAVPLLRVHDLKTGVTVAKGDQLLVYGAIFCLEYKFNPFELDYDFRIYQSDEIVPVEVDPVMITQIMETIKRFDKRIDELREEAA